MTEFLRPGSPPDGLKAHAALETDAGLLAEALLLVDRPTLLVTGSWGDNARIVWANAALVELSGHGVGDLAGQQLGGLLRTPAGDPGPTWMQPRRRRARAMRLACNDGESLDVWVVAHPLTPRGGRVPWAVMLSPLDDVARAQQHLQLVEDRFSAVTRQAPVGILYTAVGLRAAFVNDAFSELWGRPADALMGTEWLAGVDPRDLPALVDAAKVALSGSGIQELQLRVGSDGGRIAQLRMAALLEPGQPAALVATAEEVTERLRLQAELRRQAERDPLTGVANRTRLIEHLAGLAAAGADAVAVAYVDLDSFKTVNDTLGHEGGDQLLVATAERLARAGGPSALTARLGGDEFAVVVTGPDADPGGGWAQGLLAAVCESLDIDGAAVDPTASIGLACGRTDQNLQQLLRDADHAMYDGKRRGTGRVTVFDPVMLEQRARERELVADLRQALELDELTVKYQPVVRVTPDGAGVQLAGVEALARWTHPRHGEVPPTVFVEAAETAGLVVALDIQVLSKAVGQIPKWDAELGRLAPQWVSVNLSAHHLADPGLVDLVRYLLNKHGVAGHRLCLEVTETVLVEDRATAAKVLQRLRDLGPRIAVDDFGTGYSSLAYLAELPVNALKLDRAFTMALDSARHRAIVSAIIDVANSLGLLVIAEGVENGEQLRTLTGLGCDLIQGWAVAKAATPEDLIGIARSLDPAGVCHLESHSLAGLVAQRQAPAEAPSERTVSQ